MRRRELITLLGGAAATWPLAARAQENARLQRVGVLMALAETDPEARAQLAGLTQGLVELGWLDGRTVQMNIRWAAGSIDRAQMYAKHSIE